MTSNDIMKGLTRTGGPFCRRRWVVVPRVYWGWDLRYEADLIAVSKTGTCTEVEIKISKQDLDKDKEKDKWTRGLDERVSRFYYAVPPKLQDHALSTIPELAGLIVVKPGNEATASLPVGRVIRRAKTIERARKPSPDEVLKLHHLGVMRYWDLFLKEQP